MKDSDAIFATEGGHRYRYVLTRKIDGSPPSERRLLAVMLNPSKADGTYDDMTITKCLGFGSRWGYGRFRAVNFFALISTDPKGLLTVEDPIGRSNDNYLYDMLRWADDVWWAWGDSPILYKPIGVERVEEVKQIMRDTQKVRPRPFSSFHLGLTASGQPKHPSRLAYSTPRVEVSP